VSVLPSVVIEVAELTKWGLPANAAAVKIAAASKAAATAKRFMMPPV
jgi:hypothetical protein